MTLNFLGPEVFFKAEKKSYVQNLATFSGEKVLPKHKPSSLLAVSSRQQQQNLGPKKARLFSDKAMPEHVEQLGPKQEYACGE